MILPDVNLLVHAYNLESPVHSSARSWWEGLLNGTRPVGLAWAAMLGFVRITTHRHILTNPLPVRAACARVRTWLAGPYVIEHQAELHSTDRDFDRFPGLRWTNPLA